MLLFILQSVPFPRKVKLIMARRLKTKVTFFAVLLLIIVLPVVVYLARNPLFARADSLIGFNEGGGTTVKDSKGSPTGTITNAAWKTSSDCLFGSCLFFDGTGDYVSFGDEASYDFIAATNFTIEFWFRTTDITSGIRVFVSKYRGDDAEGGYKVYMSSDGKVNFGVDDDNTWSPGPDDIATSPNAYDDNLWHHVVAVKTGTTSLTLYIDGLRVHQDPSLTASGTLVNDDPLTIGMDADLTSNPYTGFIDELKIYTTTARTEAQIKTDFVKGSTSTGTAASFGPDTSLLSQGLVGYWKLNETSGAATDSSGNAQTLTDASSTTFGAGKFNKGADLESTSTDYQYLADNPILSLTGSLTLSAWIKPESVTAATLFDIVGKWDGANESYLLSQYGDEIRLYIDAAATYVTTDNANLAAGTWYHITAVYETATRKINIYKDGSVVSATYTGAIPASIGDDGGRFHIGAEDSTGGAANYYDGIVDEVRVYNRALLASEVAQVYRYTPGPVAWWKLNEGSGQYAYDSSGNGYTGTFGATTGVESSDPIWSPGHEGFGIQIDNTDRYITLGDILDVDATGSLTVEAWMRRSVDASTETIVGKRNTDSTVGYALTCVGSAGTSYLEFGIHDGTDAWVMQSQAGTCPASSAWQNVTAVLDRSDANKSFIYINGIDVTSTRTGTFSNVGDLSNILNLYIGISGTDITKYDPMNGYIDDVKIYNYPRTQEQVILDYHSSQHLNDPAVVEPNVHFSFNESSGTRASDSTNNNEPASVLNNPTWTPSGKFGRALSFTAASSQEVELLDNATLSITGNLTLAAWIKPSSNTAGTQYTIISKWGTSNQSYMLAQYGDEIRFYLNGSSNYVATTDADLQTGTWYHIIGMYYASNQKAEIYINNVSKNVSVNGTIPSSLPDSIANLSVGSQLNSNALGSVTLTIATNADDGFEDNNTTWYASGSSSKIYFGHWGTSDEEVGFRFSNVQIPYGATVTNAYLNLVSVDSYGTLSNVHLRIYGDSRVDSPPAFGSTDRPSQVTPTSNYVDWDPSAWPSFDTVTTPNIGPIIQEIANTSGWNSGESLRLVVWNDGTTGDNDIGACDYSSTDPSCLATYTDITYTAVSAENFYDGVIDEVYVYPSYLTQVERAMVMNDGKATLMGAVSTDSSGVGTFSPDREFCVPGDTGTCNTPVAYWKFDENTGTTFYDSSINKYNLTNYLCSWTRWEIGKFGSSLRAYCPDGGTSVQMTAALNIGTTHTISLWLKSSDPDDAVLVGNTTGIYGMYISDFTSGNVYYSPTNGNNVNVAHGGLTNGSWWHLAVVRNGTSVTFYKNGTQIGATQTLASNDAMSIWALFNHQNTVGYPFYGNLDEVKVYTYARTPAQIAWDYNRGAPVAWYKFDETSWTSDCSTDTVFDSSGNSLHADACPNPGGQTTPETGKFNGAMHFDDSDDYVTAADNNYLDLTAGLSISAWVNTDANEPDNVIVSKGTSYEVGINGDGDVYWDGVDAQVDDNRAKVLAGSWHHIVVTNNDTTATYYVDGVPTGTSPAGIDADNATALRIGYDSANYFDGLIDDVRIYNYVLNPTQVKTVMNNGALRFSP